MALWLDLIPRLHRAPDLDPENFGPDNSKCDGRHPDDNAAEFEQFAARVADPDCAGNRKQIPTVEEHTFGVMTSFPVVTRPSRRQRRTTQSFVTPRYRLANADADALV